jgi:hypothetical protein
MAEQVLTKHGVLGFNSSTMGRGRAGRGGKESFGELVKQMFSSQIPFRLGRSRPFCAHI